MSRPTDAARANLRRRPAVVLRAPGGPSSDGNQGTTIVCGALEPLGFRDAQRAWRVQVLPSDPLISSSSSSPASSSSTSTMTGTRRRWTGCGAVIHTGAVPVRRGTDWTGWGEGVSSSEVVPLDEVYWTEGVRTMPELVSASEGRAVASCGCISRGVGCAVCGNALGIERALCSTHALRGPRTNYVFLNSAVSTLEIREEHEGASGSSRSATRAAGASSSPASTLALPSTPAAQPSTTRAQINALEALVRQRISEALSPRPPSAVPGPENTAVSNDPGPIDAIPMPIPVHRLARVPPALPNPLADAIDADDDIPELQSVSNESAEEDDSNDSDDLSDPDSDADDEVFDAQIRTMMDEVLEEPVTELPPFPTNAEMARESVVAFARIERELSRMEEAIERERGAGAGNDNSDSAVGSGHDSAVGDRDHQSDFEPPRPTPSELLHRMLAEYDQRVQANSDDHEGRDEMRMGPTRAREGTESSIDEPDPLSVPARILPAPELNFGASTSTAAVDGTSDRNAPLNPPAVAGSLWRSMANMLGTDANNRDRDQDAATAPPLGLFSDDSDDDSDDDNHSLELQPTPAPPRPRPPRPRRQRTLRTEAGVREYFGLPQEEDDDQFGDELDVFEEFTEPSTSTRARARARIATSPLRNTFIPTEYYDVDADDSANPNPNPDENANANTDANTDAAPSFPVDLVRSLNGFDADMLHNLLDARDPMTPGTAITTAVEDSETGARELIYPTSPPGVLRAGETPPFVPASESPEAGFSLDREEGQAGQARWRIADDGSIESTTAPNVTSIPTTTTTESTSPSEPFLPASLLASLDAPLLQSLQEEQNSGTGSPQELTVLQAARFDLTLPPLLQSLQAEQRAVEQTPHPGTAATAADMQSERAAIAAERNRLSDMRTRLAEMRGRLSEMERLHAVVEGQVAEVRAEVRAAVAAAGPAAGAGAGVGGPGLVQRLMARSRAAATGTGGQDDDGQTWRGQMVAARMQQPVAGTSTNNANTDDTPTSASATTSAEALDLVRSFQSMVQEQATVLDRVAQVMTRLGDTAGTAGANSTAGGGVGDAAAAARGSRTSWFPRNRDLPALYPATTTMPTAAAAAAAAAQAAQRVSAEANRRLDRALQVAAAGDPRTQDRRVQTSASPPNANVRAPSAVAERAQGILARARNMLDEQRWSRNLWMAETEAWGEGAEDDETETEREPRGQATNARGGLGQQAHPVVRRIVFER
ncbi:hypothetical protein HMN09_00978700 [Mycena chlorophos]|uniref:Uncharacterized protein n=1 Tax=Mycena chlorophos TaxID=658473 RepID=A0A8H6VZB4_MYCCL|nr:hypothetical protein HMN09_00978700 [Mycena chlorophos]